MLSYFLFVPPIIRIIIIMDKSKRQTILPYYCNAKHYVQFNVSLACLRFDFVTIYVSVLNLKLFWFGFWVLGFDFIVCAPKISKINFPIHGIKKQESCNRDRCKNKSLRTGGNGSSNNNTNNTLTKCNKRELCST